MAKYRVTAAYVTVKTNTDMGPMVIGLYQGGSVPDDAPEWWISHHLGTGQIEKLPEPAPPAPPPEPEPAPRRSAAASRGA